MTSALSSSWLDGLFSQSEIAPVQEQAQGHSETAFVTKAGEQADPLSLPWCTDGGAALSGTLHPLVTAPLMCRACYRLGGVSCQSAANPPPLATAARCQSFAPRDGVTIGKVWLWRVGLIGGGVVWLSCLPERSQRQAIQTARAEYGDKVLSVHPCPGFDAIP